MILEKNNLQRTQEWTKSCIKFTASYVHPKNSNHLRSHLRAIMALDHRRLIRPGKKIPADFLRSTSLITKSCQQIWVRVNQPFITFIRHIWGETILWGTVFIIQTSDRMHYFTIFQYKLTPFNILDDRSTRRLIRPASSHFCSLSCGRLF